MIDKKRLTRLIVLTAAALAAVVIVIVWTVTAASRSGHVPAPTARSAAGSSTPTPGGMHTPGSGATEGSYDDVLAFTPQLSKNAATAALAASAWSQATTQQILVSRYTAAHIAPEVAATYTPVWVQIFTPVKSAEVTTNLGGEPALSTVSGEKGHRTFLVGVPILYSAVWQSLDGTPAFQQSTSTTWWVTVDESTGQITKIAQPAARDLQISVSR